MNRDLRQIALAGRILDIAHTGLGIYAQKVIGGAHPYETRSEWQEGWNRCTMELSEHEAIISDWVKQQDSRLLEDLILDDRLSISLHDKAVQLWVDCSDLFYWACADGEDIGMEELPSLLECLAINSEYGPELWCCRKRKMRPQQPYYKNFPAEMHALFDACGPERAKGTEG